MLIRADASVQAGTGHVMRCLALAQAWQDAGGRVTFVMANTIPVLSRRLRTEGMHIVPLRCVPGSTADANQTLEIAQSTGTKWVVLDGYRFNERYQSDVKAAGLKLLVVDDIAHCRHYSADTILNQNFHANERMYTNRDAGTRLLLGPRFALLRREFLKWRDKKPQAADIANKILITFGGSDPDNCTAKVLDAVNRFPSGSLELVVVGGAANPNLNALKKVCARSVQKCRLAQNPKSLATYMCRADVVISAAGSTSLETCCIGIPAILVAVAQNQEPGAKELARRGVAAYLGSIDTLSRDKVATELRQLLSSKEARARMSEIGRELVDGHGCQRVLTALQSTTVKLRRANQNDCRMLWEWRNDATVRAASFQSDYIPWDTHEKWFAQKLESGEAIIYIGEDDSGTPIGQLRLDWSSDREAQISVLVAEQKRGAAIAPSLILTAAQMAFRETLLQQLRAHIKPDNQASLRAFKKAGFENFQRLGDVVHCTLKRGAVE